VTPPDEPKPRAETLRQALTAALRERPQTARELSGAVRIAEREVLDHLAHLERSLAAAGEQLVIEPARCKSCGFAFEARARHGRPSRCPECRSERISTPRFSIVRAGST
jgi:predicted Zn-ribbon and HTH transcriptional regulator